eukprot:COSAG01_NODE_795_length_13541_cov_5.530725_4_plen_447_part_00
MSTSAPVTALGAPPAGVGPQPALSSATAAGTAGVLVQFPTAAFQMKQCGILGSAVTVIVDAASNEFVLRQSGKPPSTFPLESVMSISRRGSNNIAFYIKPQHEAKPLVLAAKNSAVARDTAGQIEELLNRYAVEVAIPAARRRKAQAKADRRARAMERAGAAAPTKQRAGRDVLSLATPSLEVLLSRAAAGGSTVLDDLTGGGGSAGPVSRQLEHYSEAGVAHQVALRELRPLDASAAQPEPEPEPEPGPEPAVAEDDDEMAQEHGLAAAATLEAGPEQPQQYVRIGSDSGPSEETLSEATAVALKACVALASSPAAPELARTLAHFWWVADSAVRAQLHSCCRAYLTLHVHVTENTRKLVTGSKEQQKNPSFLQRSSHKSSEHAAQLGEAFLVNVRHFMDGIRAHVLGTDAYLTALRAAVAAYTLGAYAEGILAVAVRPVRHSTD